jgi:hypothetical protein
VGPGDAGLLDAGAREPAATLGGLRLERPPPPPPLSLSPLGAGLATLPESPACVASALGWSVPRWHDAGVNAVFIEAQAFVARGLREAALAVNQPVWPACLTQPPASPASCAGRAVVLTFICYRGAIAGATNVTGWPLGTRLVWLNLEVLGGEFGCGDDPRVRALLATGRVPVWEYTQLNVRALVAAGALPADAQRLSSASAVVTLGAYPGIVAPEFERPPPQPGAPGHRPPSIDVLLLADVAPPRRAALVAALRAGGVRRVKAVTGVYGHKRDALVRSAALVLNVHFFDDPALHALEQVRLQVVLAAGGAVLSESTPDASAAAEWAPGVAFAPYTQLVPRALALLANATARWELAAAGHALVRRASPRARLWPALKMALAVLRDESVRRVRCARGGAGGSEVADTRR